MAASQTTLPLSTLDTSPVSLDPTHLPVYALRTTMRMLLAIVCLDHFHLCLRRPLPPRAGRAEMVLIPAARYSAIGADPRIF